MSLSGGRNPENKDRKCLIAAMGIAEYKINCQKQVKQEYTAQREGYQGLFACCAVCRSATIWEVLESGSI